MRLPILIFLASLFTTQLSGQVYFSKNQVLEDLATLKTTLEEAHPNLFAYTTKYDFEALYHELKNQIHGDSVSLLRTTGVFQQLSAIVNNGHTYVDFPIQPYVRYLQEGGTLFPLEITFEDGKAYVRKDWSPNAAIQPGDEVVSINGRFMDEITAEIYPYISAERPYFKLAKIEFYSFPRYYWQVFGKQDSYRVRIKNRAGVRTVVLQSIDANADFESKRTEIYQSERQLKYFDQVAYLNPGAFSGNEPEFQSFIDSVFVDIKQQKSRHLIIDLRNNTGGNDSFSDYMVSYFADKPFRWCSDFEIRSSKLLKELTRKYNDTTTTYNKEILSKRDGEVYAPALKLYQPQPAQKRYKGKIYVLVNRLSISQSTVTAAQIKDYGWGMIVGEETGEYPSLYASVLQYPLPNTSIVVTISKGRITRVSGSRREEGLIPDILIRDHLLDENDEILDELLKMIGQEE